MMQSSSIRASNSSAECQLFLSSRFTRTNAKPREHLEQTIGRVSPPAGWAKSRSSLSIAIFSWNARATIGTGTPWVKNRRVRLVFVMMLLRRGRNAEGANKMAPQPRSPSPAGILGTPFSWVIGATGIQLRRSLVSWRILFRMGRITPSSPCSNDRSNTALRPVVGSVISTWV